MTVKEQLQKHVRAWVILCEEHYGCKPIIYSSIGFYLKYLKGKCGDIGASKEYISLVDWAVWQYEIGPLRGVKGKVDKNKLHPSFNYNLLKIKL